ncbi:hypothetical protein M885DRAFT_557331 [Pelagophyceae sp. CCMP2097]|nr:hypothetical protein M885DRAFT_557331 [Pelagophyceae sp. CCMP2097]
MSMHSYQPETKEAMSDEVVEQSEAESEFEGLPQEYYCGSCLCCLRTLYVPKSCAQFSGMFGQGLACCINGESSWCVLPSHPRFKELHGSWSTPEDSCCILMTGESSVVKPLFLIGDKPMVKTSWNGLCCTQRCAIPCFKDVDVAPTCGFLALKACDCYPFKFNATCLEAVAPLVRQPTDSAFAALPAKVSDLFLLCQCCCCQQASYVPESTYDAFGCQGRDRCCCCLDCACFGCQLPLDPSGYELFLCSSGQYRCVKPRCACKGNSRCGFCFTKYALPPDDDVPCACVCCGKKAFGPTSIEKKEAFTYPIIAPPAVQDMPERKADKAS